MSDGIEWADPPETALFPGQRGRYTEFITALKANPERWAILPGEKNTNESAKNAALNIRNGKTRGFVKGEYETAVDGTRVYVRYVPRTDPKEPGDDPADAAAAPYDPTEVRAWGRENGYELSERGQLPARVVQAYLDAHSEPPDEDETV